MAPALLDAPAAPDLMTVDEFWDFCQLEENQHRNFELIRGEVVEMPNPTRRHGRVCVSVGFELESYARKIGRGYVVTNDSGVILFNDPDTVVGPDVAYFTDAARFDDIHPKWGEALPVLAVEVLSPSDKLRKVMAKIEDYLQSGVAAVWLVNYEERFLTVFRKSVIPRSHGESATLSGDDYLPGFSCSVGDFFRMPGEPVPAS